MVVYFHRNPKTNKVFYVGIGVAKKRAGRLAGRSDYWKRYVAKHGNPIIQIVHENLSKEDACELERRYIKFYGKKINGGCLVNLADGGETNAGYIHTIEQRKKIAERAKLKGVSHMAGKEVRRKAAETLSRLFKGRFKGTDNPNFGNKWTEEMKIKMSEKKKGVPMVKGNEKRSEKSKAMWTNASHRQKVTSKMSITNKKNWEDKDYYNSHIANIRKTWDSENRLSALIAKCGVRVKNTETGEVFNTIVSAANSHGINPATLRFKLNGKIRNNTPFIILQHDSAA